MRIGLIWGVDTWMTYPYLIGGDDFTAHPLVFARGIESQKTQNSTLGMGTGATLTSACKQLTNLITMSKTSQTMRTPKIYLPIILMRSRFTNLLKSECLLNRFTTLNQLFYSYWNDAFFIVPLCFFIHVPMCNDGRTMILVS